MLSYLQRKRVPTRDINLDAPPNRWRFFGNWLFYSLMPGMLLMKLVGKKKTLPTLHKNCARVQFIFVAAFFSMLTTPAMADVTFSAEIQATGEEQTMQNPEFKEFSDNFPYLRRHGSWSKKCSSASRTVCLPALCEIDYTQGDGSGYGKVIKAAWKIEASSYKLDKDTKCLTSYARVCNKRHWGGGGKYDGYHVIYGKCPTVQSWSSTQVKENISFRASDGYKWVTDYEGQIGTPDAIPNTVTNVQYNAKIIPGSQQPSNAALSVGMFNGHPKATEENGPQFWAINSAVNDDKLVLRTANPPLICQSTKFEVTVKAENTVAVDGAEIHLKFDPSQLQVSSITTSSNFDTELLSEYDNRNGSIEFMAMDSKLITDSIFDIFTVKFSAVGTDTSTSLEFLNSSQFTAGLEPLPSVAAGKQQINFAHCLNYQVDLQRAKPKGDASWITGLTVSVGTLIDAVEYSSTTNEFGRGILMLNQPLGATEYFCVRSEQSLANKVIPPFTKSGGRINLSKNNRQNSPLLEGDVALKGSNNKPVAGFDGILNLIDFSYIQKNKIDLDKSGDSTGDVKLFADNLKKMPLNAKKKRESACIETATVNGSMLRRGSRDSRGNEGLEQLLANALPTNLVEGESFDVTLTINATDTNPVDGTEINLEYDPDSLRVNTVTPTESLDILLSDFDNSQGLLSLIAVAWKTPPLTSTFDLVTINFTLLQEGGVKTLQFSEDERQESMVFAGGKLVEDLEEIILPQVETTSSNKLPTAVLALTPATGNIPLTVALDGSASSDTDGTIASYAWMASDGQIAEGKNAALTFNQAGDYTITLKVTDDKGAIHSATAKVTAIVTAAGGKYTAYGTIRDELGNKLAGVEVQVAGQTVTTDAAGNWKIPNLPEGEYSVTVSKDGYTFAPEKVALGNDEFRQETVLAPLSKLKVKVVAEPRVVNQNDNVTYIATVINGGNETATGVVLTDVLPVNAAGLVSIATLDGGECDADTVTCTLPDLTTGNSARAKLVVSNTQTKSLLNTATVTTNEYPADVQKTWTRVIPHLAASITDSPEPLQLPLPGEPRMLHYDVAATLNANAPSAATGVNLVITLPKGVELQAVNSDYAMCDVSQVPTLTCQLTDLSVANADSVSHATVGIDVVLKDAGLLALTLEAKLSANEYPVHTDKERTKIFIDPKYKVDLAFVIDDTGSMQSEINQVKQALTDFIDALGSNEAPMSVLLTFGDQVKYRAVTQDMVILRDAIGKLKATGGGTCPEASYEAISFAIPHVKEGGTILFATDASPYEGSDVDDMVARLRSNGIIFNAMVFGDCADENSWNQPETQ